MLALIFKTIKAASSPIGKDAAFYFRYYGAALNETKGLTVSPMTCGNLPSQR